MLWSFIIPNLCVISLSSVLFSLCIHFHHFFYSFLIYTSDKICIPKILSAFFLDDKFQRLLSLHVFLLISDPVSNWLRNCFSFYKLWFLIAKVADHIFSCQHKSDCIILTTDASRIHPKTPSTLVWIRTRAIRVFTDSQLIHVSWCKSLFFLIFLKIF